jgi:C-terminal processing protease CtpA/Prc
MLRLPAWLVCAEVLEGLGITRGGPVRFDFDGGRSATFQPIAAADYVRTIGFEHDLSRPNGPQPLWLSNLHESQFVRTIDDGRALYVGYHHTTEPTDELAARILRIGRRPTVRRVVVDVRMNGGGNNTTFRPLVEALAKPVLARKTYVLMGRTTFSAAGNFVADVEQKTEAKLVGEPSGGAPNQWGDNELVELPRAGLTVRVANSFWVFGRGAKDRRVAVRPDIAVAMTAADFFAGRDPVLERALR